MHRFLKLTGIIILLITLVLVVDNYFLKYISLFGCDYRNIVMKGSENGHEIYLNSSLSFEEFRKIVTNNPNYINNPNYQGNREGSNLLYVSRILNTGQVDMIASKTDDNKINYRMYMFSIDKYQRLAGAGVSCYIPNFIVVNDVNTFIRGLNLPIDTESQMLMNFSVEPITSISFF